VNREEEIALIIEHKVQGSVSLQCTFTIAVEGMNVILSQGKYVLKDEILISSAEEVKIPITSEKVPLNYELWLVQDGVFLRCAGPSEFAPKVENPIDKLAWFTVPPGTTNLTSVDINLLRVVN
jgi:hypothetical protein